MTKCLKFSNTISINLMISSPLQPFRNRNTMDLLNWLLDFPAESFPVLLCIFPYNILVKESQTKIEHGYTQYFLTFSWINEQIFCSSPAQMQGLYKRETRLRKKKKKRSKTQKAHGFSFIFCSVHCSCSPYCLVLTKEIKIEKTIFMRKNFNLFVLQRMLQTYYIWLWIVFSIFGRKQIWLNQVHR